MDYCHKIPGTSNRITLRDLALSLDSDLHMISARQPVHRVDGAELFIAAMVEDGVADARHSWQPDFDAPLVHSPAHDQFNGQTESRSVPVSLSVSIDILRRHRLHPGPGLSAQATPPPAALDRVGNRRP
jgi:hypothetical protein